MNMTPVDRASTGLSLLIVEDDRRLAGTLSASFTARGYVVRCAGSIEEAMALLAAEAPDRAIVDLKLEGGNGLELLAALAAAETRPRIVVLTGYASIATTVEAIKLGATQYLAKPATAREIEAAFLHEAGRDVPDVMIPRVSALRTQEWETIQRVLTETEFNISEAARRLGMHRRTLARKLAKQPVK